MLMSMPPNFQSIPDEEVREYIVSVNQKGMVTIPLAVRRFLNSKPKGQVVFRISGATVEIKAMSMTLADTYGSVTPLNRPENFKHLRQVAREERVEKFISKMKS